MKSPLILLAILAFLTSVLAFSIKEKYAFSPLTYRQAELKRPVIRCSPDWDMVKDWLEEYDIPPIPGAGSYQWKISTKNDSAQFYFNQGINMYYSFHIIESMASFKKAAKFDPDCAILYWAQALAYGPNINDMGYAASPEALMAVNRANILEETASPVEKGLIGAITVRYTADSADVNRKQLNEAYTAKMAVLYEQYPRHADVATLYADAMMLEHPWDLWKNDGYPKPWTPRIRQVLEKLLILQPDNPGANHYYIHVMEPSPYASLATACADRLGKLTPGLSHTVHMPSHIYLRTGNYTKGITVNEQAVSSYKKTIPLYAPVTGADFLYIIHNLHMQTNHAMMAGLSSYAVKTADELVKSIPEGYLSIPGAFGNLVQYIYMTPVLVDVRFGNWNNLLQRTAPPASMIYARILYHFGRGMALAQQQKTGEALAEWNAIQQLSSDSTLQLPFPPFSPAIEGVKVASQLLKGSIALQKNEYSEAIAALEKAVQTESGMVYNEPRDWLLNPKHYLANALIQANRWKEAEQILKQDMNNNRENGWALFGYWQVLKAENRNAEATRMLTRFRKAFLNADVKLKGPVF